MDKFRNDPELMNIVIEKLYQRCGEAELEEICALLEELYLIDGKPDIHFRHEYASISGKMEELRNEFDDESNPFDLQNISININLLYEYAEKHNKVYLKNLYKLRDHICLEIGRIEYADKINASIMNAKSELHIKIDDALLEVNNIDERIEASKRMLAEIEQKHKEFSAEIIETKKTLQKTKKELEDTKISINKSKKKIKKYQQESIAILGIFAAIVLSFTGGFAFTSSVLENFQNGTIYRWLAAVLLIGFVLINILYALFYYIDRIVNETALKIKPLWIINVLLIALMLLVGIAWGFGWIEHIQKENIESTFYSNTISSSDVYEMENIK